MESLKVTSWNLEHADKLLDRLSDDDATRRRHAEARAEAVTEEIARLEADILLVSEGPRGEARATEFFARTAPGYRLITRGDDAAYGMKGGNSFTGRQWLWFLVRDESPITGQLLHLDRWQALTEAASGGAHRAGRWEISYPKWEDPGDSDARLEFSIPETHAHWRHPQVLQAEIGGSLIELIGCHLKSKYNDALAEGHASDADFFAMNPRLVADLIKARVKISTEAADVRHYIEARFEAQSDASIMVLGDLNDGPGKERIERRFLYHDLIGALQGDVFFARRFLNHALFDAPDGERWSVHFEDALDPGRDPHILLDHILFSQAMTRSHRGTRAAFLARPGGGQVEHQVHHLVTSARPKYAMTSDHKPVSMIFDRAPPA